METIELTIKEKWKVEKKTIEQLTTEPRPSKGATVAKWIFTIFVGIGLTCSLVVTKVSFISMCTYTYNTSSYQNEYDDTKAMSHYLIVFLALLTSYSLQLVRSVWHVIHYKEDPWPGVKSSFYCVLAGSLETAGVVIMALKVAPKFGPTLTVFTMVLTMILPILWETKISLNHDILMRLKLSNVCSCLCLLIGLSIYVYLVYDFFHLQQNFRAADIVHLILSVLLLNFAWLPSLLQLISRNGQKGRQRANRNRINVGDDNENMETTVCSTQWKASVLILVTKILSAFVFFFVFYFLDSDRKLKFDQSVLTIFLQAWNFSSFVSITTWVNFSLYLVFGMVCYVFVWGVNYMNLWRGCVALSLFFSLIITIVIFQVEVLCLIQDNLDFFCALNLSQLQIVLTACATATFAASQLCMLIKLLRCSGNVYMLSERKLFWIPASFAGAFESNLILNSQEIKCSLAKPGLKIWPSKVYICTTMYRETSSEMERVLKSLAVINISQRHSKATFESHIFFDGGIVGDKLTKFSLQVMALLEDELGIKLVNGTHLKTAYGLKIQWTLPVSNMDDKKMNFILHLKDNELIKNRKRWSQVMYISYILDYCKNKQNDNAYILMTDGDVSFTPQSIELLLDQICRDKLIGAVCARIYPEGLGPVVWYQSFEYASAYWLQKTAEQMLGSVLCAPGCFSIYRCTALKDVIAKYSTPVNNTNDFLLKDQGGDRWLSTLLIQSGWSIKYCPDSKVAASCPSSFEDFFIQRRRWMTSSLTNSLLFLEDWKYIASFNNRISVALLFYHIMSFIAVVISPGFFIFIAAGVFENTSSSVTLELILAVLQAVLIIFYALYCLKASHVNKIRVAIVFLFFYIFYMEIVVFLAARYIVKFLSQDSSQYLSHSIGSSHDISTPGYSSFPQHNMTSVDLTVEKAEDYSPDYYLPVLSLPCAYLGIIVAFYVAVIVIHLSEVKHLFHGILYLMCAPCTYLILPVYCICNLNEYSWGLREEIPKAVVKKTQLCTKTIIPALKKLFFCCVKVSNLQLNTDNTESTIELVSDIVAEVMSDDEDAPSDKMSPDENKKTVGETSKKKTDKKPKTRVKQAERKKYEESSDAEVDDVQTKVKVKGKQKSKGEIKDLKGKKKAKTKSDSGSDADSSVDTEITIFKEEPVHLIQKLLNTSNILDMETNEPCEHMFWNSLISRYLKPEADPTVIEKKKAELKSLRNGWLIILALVNLIVLILLLALNWFSSLDLPSTNHVGTTLLVIFLLPSCVQFLNMIGYEIWILSSKVAKANYFWNKSYHAQWTFFTQNADNRADGPENYHRTINDIEESTTTPLLQSC